MNTRKLLLLALLLCACRGQLSLGDDAAPEVDNDAPSLAVDDEGPSVQPQAPWDGEGPGVETVDEIAVDGLRRLTRSEIGYALLDAIGVDPGSTVEELPLDIGGTTVFDNVVASQSVSAVEISEYQRFAEAYSAQVAAADVASSIGGCTPTGADDLDCLTAVTERLGRLLFRRDYSRSEAERVVATLVEFAIEDDDFDTGVELVVTYFVLHPEFLYRAESAGTLEGYALAARLSFLLWGSGPDEELLLAAESGALFEADERRAQARRMLADERARRQWRRFHAMWLGFTDHTLPDDLAEDMLAETNHLVDRVVFEGGDWLDLLRADETFVTPGLAEFYGLPVPSSPGWVHYDARRGGGVLSHATVLNHGHKGGNFDDTSPTVRGYELYKRLSCGTFGGIPEDVDPDNPPGAASDCKADAYDMRERAACASCHVITDGIGFGLENFGTYGEWREDEPATGCSIDGAGEFAAQPFNGPAELGVLLAEDPAVRLCASRQLFRFATGRRETADDESAIRALASSQRANLSLTDTLVELVASPAFLTTGVSP